jgi:hypothetical protein
MMDENTQSALSAFKMTAAEFNQYDTTTADLKWVEQELAASKIGIEFWDWNSEYCSLVWETVAEDDIPKGVPAGFKAYCEVCQLGFAKLNDRWQLAVRYGIEWFNQVPDEGDDPFPSRCGFLETSRQPLAQATRNHPGHSGERSARLPGGLR